MINNTPNCTILEKSGYISDLSKNFDMLSLSLDKIITVQK